MTVKKNRNLIAFFKLLLRDVKVEILLILWHFLVVFCMQPPPAHSLLRPFLCKLKVLGWYISHASFIYIWLVIPEFSYFKSFVSSWKYLCRLLLGGFLDVTPQNLVKIISNLNQLCNASWCIRHVTFFILFLKSTWNWAKKPIFDFFSEVFRPLPPTLFRSQPNFLPNERSYGDT